MLMFSIRNKKTKDLCTLESLKKYNVKECSMPVTAVRKKLSQSDISGKYTGIHTLMEKDEKLHIDRKIKEDPKSNTCIMLIMLCLSLYLRVILLGKGSL